MQAVARHGSLRTRLPVGAVALLCLAAAGALLARPARHAAPPRVMRVLRLPFAFEPNRGQGPAGARYVAHGRGYAAELGDRGATLWFGAGRVGIGFGAGAAPARPVATQPLPQRVNYVGHGTATTGLPTYARVVYRHVWPGIDAAFHGRTGLLEYDFDVAPGADPGRIALRLGGAGVRTDRDGSLVLRLPGGRLRELRPRASQRIGGGVRPVTVRYAPAGGIVRLRLGRYDHDRPLVIDPTLTYSSYLGGSDSDAAFGVAVDPSGYVYVAGATSSSDFPNPQSQPGHGAVVAKIGPDGRVVYVTFLDAGGATAIAVDGSGHAYLTGTQGQTLTATPGVYQSSPGGGDDAWVVKLQPGGGVAYATLLGGSGADRGAGIAVDSHGDAYIGGSTTSNDFPTTSGAYERTRPPGAGPFTGFVTELDPSGGSLVYSTYLGGTGDASVNAIALDAAGEAFVTGTVNGAFPSTVGAYTTPPSGRYQAFASKLTADGSNLAFSDVLGDGVGTAIAVDAGGAPYVAGTTPSTSFPVTSGAYQQAPRSTHQAFVSKLDPSGASLAYSTYLGGHGDDGANGIAVDRYGDAYVAGATNGDYPTTASAFQRVDAGNTDAFVTKLSSTGSGLIYSGYIGGSLDDAANAIAIDPNGKMYLAGNAGSSDFRTTPDAYQSAYGGGFSDMFASEIAPTPAIATGAATVDSTGHVTLAATVNPEHHPTTLRFELGPTTAYGSTTAPADAGSGEADETLSVALGTLAPGTTYHYRALATNYAGTVPAADATFTTPPAAPPGGGPAPNVLARYVRAVERLLRRIHHPGVYRAVRVTCPATAAGLCRFTIRVRPRVRGAHTITRSVTVRPGLSTVMRLRVSPAAFRALRRARRITVAIQVEIVSQRTTAVATIRSGAGRRAGVSLF